MEGLFFWICRFCVSRSILYLQYFPYFFPIVRMRSLPNIFPCVKFPNFGIFSCFSCFSCFSRGKKWYFKKNVGRQERPYIAFLRCPPQFYSFSISTIHTFTHTFIYVAWCLPAFFGACIGRSGTATLLSAPGTIYTSPPTCFSTRPVGHYCRKNREHYSILTHCIMEYLAGQYNGKTTLICEYM